MELNSINRAELKSCGIEIILAINYNSIIQMYAKQIYRHALLTCRSGKLEHRQMGQRWGQRLGDLVLDKGKTEVRSSNKSRCVESGEAFLQGLFESDLPQIIEDNRFLRFYDYCLKFINEVDDNNETFVESIKFTAGEVFQEMVTRVNIKTGLPLDIPEIRLMYDMCRYVYNACANTSNLALGPG